MGALQGGPSHPKFWLGGPQCIWGSAPDPTGGAYSAPRPLAVLNGPTSKAREGKGRGGERGREGKGGGGRDLAHTKILQWRPL